MEYNEPGAGWWTSVCVQSYTRKFKAVQNANVAFNEGRAGVCIYLASLESW